ncbi:MAG: chromosome segregation SMC family protein [Candidatus Pacearchaeota archaeon]
MPYIKKVFMHGFKSFAKPTEVVFDRGMNIIVGPNGSGKSNVVDAICFVLGRLSAKSMRASRHSNLIYNGGKTNKPANSARVSLVFDNSDKTFSLADEEIEISRLVRRDGTSIYKINGEVKTRQEILDLLAQAGIDPEGFNIILQAQIDTIIKMRPEEKRQIIEEIAGISVYEDRKLKSLNELEKTEGKLKEINTVLRERSAYMNNLEKERKQALRHEYLKKQIKNCKASVLNKKIEIKEKEIKKIGSSIDNKQKDIEKITKLVDISKKSIESNLRRIQEIEKRIEKETGIAQEKLRTDLLALKTEVATLDVKKENLRDQIESTLRKEESNIEEKKRLEQAITDLKEKEKIKISKNEKENFDFINKEIEKIKKDLQELELKKKIYEIKKTEIEKKQALFEEKEKQKEYLTREITELEKEISSLDVGSIDELEIKTQKKHHETLLGEIKKTKEEIEKEIIQLLTKKEIHKKDVDEIFSLEQCPRCKQKITKEYKEKLAKDVWSSIEIIEKELDEKRKSKEEIEKEIEKIAVVLSNFIEKEKELEEFYQRKKIFISKQKQIEQNRSKLSQIELESNSLTEDINKIKKELPDYDRISKKHDDLSNRMEKLKEDLLKIKLKKPIQLYIERDFETELTLNYREIEQCERNIKQAQHDRLELEAKLHSIIKEVGLKENQLKEKEKEQELLEKKFKKLVSEKQKLQEENHKLDLKISEYQMQKNLMDQEINEYKINKARIDAELSTLKEELKEFEGSEFIKASIEELEKKLEKYEKELLELGTVNLRALEAYEKLKKEYEQIEIKVKKLDEEKQEILKVIAEIDKKKKQAFMQTFNSVNKYFGENFAMLSNKGLAFLELENKEDPFAGGVNIVIKLVKGKYMDSNALSGGEKVIVALSLIFAIQKYKPYHFYIFDEIDAALDKRNSEKLSNLISKDTKSQYIIITHNDVMINNATTLYGASMQEGVTKVVGLKI